MGTPLSLGGLFDVWSEAVARDEPTIAFEVRNGRGRFLFMMFFDPDDKATNDRLLVFLQNTRHMLELKLYGAHERGQFDIYLKKQDVTAIKRELELEDGVGLPFDEIRFVKALNAMLPTSLPLAAKVEVLRTNMPAIRNRLNAILDDHNKTELIGERQLPQQQRPKEKTLRKLYLYSTDAPAAVAAYIENLKKRNCTVAWRVPGTP
ncbi:hypothetical protein [Burkholderia cepacia]|uniref:hypothetical protein n=1 Tax=Burkholderia cepacia TaxID=292 RepID=UPI002AB6E461|nr:hypothetical protein [Burkholderia cepacia]